MNSSSTRRKTQHGSFPKKYVPSSMTHKDRAQQAKELLHSKKKYKKSQYYTRKKMASFRSRPSPHIATAKRIYRVSKIGATRELAKATGCSPSALREIIRKGQGAYYSSGSRPNQTAHSWGIARLASAITSGKSAAVDYNILKKGCSTNSPALKRANKARKAFGYGQRRTPKANIK